MSAEPIPPSAPAREARATSPVPLRTFVAMVLALLVAVFVVYAFYTKKGASGSDWQTFYQAAERWRDGRRVYTVAGGFFNPPPTLLLLRPFLVLGYIPSRIVWGVLSTAMLLLSATLSADALGWHPEARTRLLTAWWILCSVPTMLLVPLTGNTSAVVLLSLSLSLWLFGRGREGLAGAALALTLIKPQLAVLGLLLLLYKRRWRALGGCAAATALVVAVSLPLVGLPVYGDFLGVERDVAGWTTSNDALQLDVPGLHGMFLQQWPHSNLADLAANGLSVLVVIALAAYWRGPWRPGTARFAAGWAQVVLCTLLVASYAHSYDLVLLVLPALVIYRVVRSAWGGPLLVALYVAPMLVLLCRQHFMVPALLLAILALWRVGEG